MSHSYSIGSIHISDPHPSGGGLEHVLLTSLLSMSHFLCLIFILIAFLAVEGTDAFLNALREAPEYPMISCKTLASVGPEVAHAIASTYRDAHA